MNPSPFAQPSFFLKTTSGLLAMILFVSIAQESSAQCQNGSRVGNSTNNNVANGNNGTGFRNFPGNNFTGNNVNAQQTILQQMLRAQFMSMMMQQAQPQQRPVVPPMASNQGRTNRTVTTPARVRPPRDPTRPLTRQEERIERLREKEKAKRTEYQARIAAREQELAERRASQ